MKYLVLWLVVLLPMISQAARIEDIPMDFYACDYFQERVVTDGHLGKGQPPIPLKTTLTDTPALLTISPNNVFEFTMLDRVYQDNPNYWGNEQMVAIRSKDDDGSVFFILLYPKPLNQIERGLPVIYNSSKARVLMGCRLKE